jgi:hypothetical protein
LQSRGNARENPDADGDADALDRQSQGRLKGNSYTLGGYGHASRCQEQRTGDNA